MGLNFFEELRSRRSERELSRPAVRTAAGILCYRSLFEHALSLGEQLTAAGLSPGDRVLLVAPNLALRRTPKRR